MKIVFCADPKIIGPLQVALMSVQQNCSQAIDFYVICIDWSENNKADFSSSLSAEKRIGSLALIDFSSAYLAEKLGGTMSLLHGNYSAYARLFLAELLPDVEKVIYLDCDIIVTGDLLKLWQLDISSYPLAAVDGGSLRDSIDQNFLVGLGVSSQARYFNSGVLLINLSLWRGDKTSENLARQFGGTQAPSHDQTLLNFRFHDSFLPFPVAYNYRIYPWSRPIEQEKLADICVVHFLGRPKPWDLGGKQLHGNSQLYYQFSERAGVFNLNPGRSLIEILLEAWSIRKSYLRLLHRLFRR